MRNDRLNSEISFTRRVNKYYLLTLIYVVAMIAMVLLALIIYFSWSHYSKINKIESEKADLSMKFLQRINNSDYFEIDSVRVLLRSTDLINLEKDALLVIENSVFSTKIVTNYYTPNKKIVKRDTIDLRMNYQFLGLEYDTLLLSLVNNNHIRFPTIMIVILFLLLIICIITIRGSFMLFTKLDVNYAFEDHRIMELTKENKKYEEDMVTSDIKIHDLRKEMTKI